MSLMEFNWKPSDRQLRQFGLISLVVLPALAWFWTGGNPRAVGIFAAIGTAIGLTGLAAPQLLKPPFLLLMLVAAPLGLIVGELSMVCIYFGVFLPMRLLFGMMGRDRLNLAIEKEKPSYWQPKAIPPSAASYYRQF